MALYPFDSDAASDGASITTTLPSRQKGCHASFSTNSFPMIARSNSDQLHFRNVCGGIKFTLSRDDIRSITFKGNNNEDIAGKVKLVMDEDGNPVASFMSGEKSITITPDVGRTFRRGTVYYIVLPPCEFAKGFSMIFTGALLSGTFNYADPVVIKRSVFSVKKKIDTFATFVDESRTTPFTMTSIGESTIALKKVGNPDLIELEYRVCANKWAKYSIGSEIAIHNGESIQFRAIIKNGSFARFEEGDIYWGTEDKSHYYKFCGAGGDLVVSGNIMSLIDESMKSTIVPEFCFACLFEELYSLIDASDLLLPATKLAESCYRGMFWRCSSLTAAPDLPATTLRAYCYVSMFSGCSSLTAAPDLPATTLAEGCYAGMFRGCGSLITAPELPATALVTECYSDMFDNCCHLAAAPKLPAFALAERCYQGMFQGCSSLTAAPELPATTLTEGCYQGMFLGCSSLTAAPKLPATKLAESCYWLMFWNCSSLTAAPDLPATKLAERCYQGMFWGCSSLAAAPDLPATTLAKYCYLGMFQACSSLTTVPNLPATTLTEYCYAGMFRGCSSLTIVPELPSTTMAEYCYADMFRDCESLTAVPELPATTLAKYCYSGMFSGCCRLIYVADLPAMTLATRCYESMFKDCTNLQKSPRLPAEVLVNGCYAEMFSGCSILISIEMLAIDISAKDCLTSWVDGVGLHGRGIFVRNGCATWDTSLVVPAGWAVQSTFVPVEAVVFEKRSISIEVGEQVGLFVYVLPIMATNRNLIWESSDSDVIAVQGGRLTAINPGIAFIKVTSEDGAKTDSCRVSVRGYNNHEYVDLGLSVKWATCNVGASSRMEIGDRLAWGETAHGLDGYSLSDYRFYVDGSSKENAKYSKYVTDSKYGVVDNKDILDLSDDAAHIIWGGSWRLPTKNEIVELVDKCTWTWMGAGYKVTSKVEGYTDNFIYLPALEYKKSDGTVNYATCYWTNALSDNNYYANSIYFNEKKLSTKSPGARHKGYLVRAVSE